MFSKVLSFSALALVFVFSHMLHADEVFVGIGVVIQQEQKSIQIIDVYENSPASRANIVKGEWITAVDGKETTGKKLKEVVSWLRGDEGTQVTLTLQTLSRESSRDVRLTREKVVVKCFMEGNLNLTYYSTGSSGSITGWVGDEGVNWQVNNGFIQGQFNHQVLSLNFAGDLNGNIQITGWILGTYVDWRGFNNQISSYQSCIR